MFGIRTWIWAHKWSSLVSTAFLLILCLTGLPLIFRAEIDHALGYGGAASSGAAAPLDAVERAATTARPGWNVQYFVWEPDKPGVVTLSMAPAGAKSFYDNQNVLVDAGSAQVLPDDRTGGPMDVILTLHSQLFLGPWGPLVLGVPAVLFLVALVSGAVIYAPFARRRPFGHVRLDRSRATKWLDLHNVVGVALVAWALVVASTGLINTWGEYIIRVWQMTELSAYAQAGDGVHQASRVPLDRVAAAAAARLPDAKPYFVAYPGSLMGGERFYAVYMRGESALTQFMFQPVLVDAYSARILGVPTLPWYIKTLALSQPLHFGDYGGLILKIVWAVLDIAAIFVLGSGLYLTFRSRAETGSPESAEAAP